MYHDDMLLTSCSETDVTAADFVADMADRSDLVLTKKLSLVQDLLVLKDSQFLFGLT